MVSEEGDVLFTRHCFLYMIEMKNASSCSSKWDNSMLLSKHINIGGIISAAVLVIIAGVPKCNAQAVQQSNPDTSFLSRVTVEIPVYTRHIPNDAGFNDHNWGAFINVDLAKSSALGNAELSVDGGAFTNSYRKNTAFLAGEITWSPIHINNLKIEIGPMLGVDLNGGYKGYSDVDPLLGAIQVKVSGTDFASENKLLNHLGTAITIIPGQETVINLALTVRL